MTLIDKIENQFEDLPVEIQKYFEFVPELIKMRRNSRKKRSWDPLIAYLFSRVERAHVMSLYCGVIKLHGVNPQLAEERIRNQYFFRKKFPKLYESVFEIALGDELRESIDYAYGIRDEIIHGREDNLTERKKGKAVESIFEYSKSFNCAIYNLKGARFKPFGDLTGFHKGGVPRMSEEDGKTAVTMLSPVAG